MQCCARKQDGKQCKARALAGHKRCALHAEPGRAAELGRKGGQRRATYLTLAAMKIPFRGVLFQTQKEDKVIQLIEYAKCLYKQQDPDLPAAFPLTKSIDQQPSLQLRFANGSYIAGIPGGARSRWPVFR
jgi:hypothetical protein